MLAWPSTMLVERVNYVSAELVLQVTSLHTSVKGSGRRLWANRTGTNTELFGLEGS